MINFKKADLILHKIISNKSDINVAIKLLKKEMIDFPTDQLDLNYNSFQDRVTQILDKNPISSKIAGLYIGIYESDKETILYLSGSKTWNKNDFDWACNNDYFPDDRYISLNIYNLFKKKDETTRFIFTVGITVIFIIKYSINNIKLLLNKNKELYLSTGFDDGDLYNIGKLTPIGLIE